MCLRELSEFSQSSLHEANTRQYRALSLTSAQPSIAFFALCLHHHPVHALILFKNAFRCCSAVQQRNSYDCKTAYQFLFITHSLSTVGIIIRKSLKDSANGAVKTAIELLAIAASLTQNVPYLGAISKTLTVVIKIRDVCCFEFIIIKYC
jgi:hypothetical protein